MGEHICVRLQEKSIPIYDTHRYKSVDAFIPQEPTFSVVKKLKILPMLMLFIVTKIVESLLGTVQ